MISLSIRSTVDGQPLAGAVDPVDPAALGGRGGLAHRHLPELGHPQDDGHRGVQLVAGDLDERPLEPVGLERAGRWSP